MVIYSDLIQTGIRIAGIIALFISASLERTALTAGRYPPPTMIDQVWFIQPDSQWIVFTASRTATIRAPGKGG